MNQRPVLLPGPRLLLSYTEKMGHLTTTTEDMSARLQISRCLGIPEHTQCLCTIKSLSTCIELKHIASQVSMVVRRVVESILAMSTTLL